MGEGEGKEDREGASRTRALPLVPLPPPFVALLPAATSAAARLAPLSNSPPLTLKKSAHRSKSPPIPTPPQPLALLSPTPTENPGGKLASRITAEAGVWGKGVQVPPPPPLPPPPPAVPLALMVAEEEARGERVGKGVPLGVDKAEFVSMGRGEVPSVEVG